MFLAHVSDLMTYGVVQFSRHVLFFTTNLLNDNTFTYRLYTLSLCHDYILDYFCQYFIVSA